VYNGKTFLAIIPARGGSRGLPDKNIRSFMGKPLMAYTIEAATATGVMDAIVLSTDDERYAEIGRAYGAEAPFLRPPELASDSSLVNECIVHTIIELMKTGREYDYFILLQPTSPLRTPEHIRKGVELAVNENLTSVVAFSEAEYPPALFHKLPFDFNLKGLGSNSFNKQEHETYYRINGMLYICECSAYFRTKSFYGDNGKALIIDRKYAIDIDDEYDFTLAEYLMGKLNKTGSYNDK